MNVLCPPFPRQIARREPILCNRVGRGSWAMPSHRAHAGPPQSTKMAQYHDDSHEFILEIGTVANSSQSVESQTL
jgi:ribosomal protein L37E